MQDWKMMGRIAELEKRQDRANSRPTALARSCRFSTSDLWSAIRYFPVLQFPARPPKAFTTAMFYAIGKLHTHNYETSFVIYVKLELQSSSFLWE